MSSSADAVKSSVASALTGVQSTLATQPAENLAAGAFAGGLLLAMIIKRLG